MFGRIKKAIKLLKTDSFEILRGKLSKRYRGFRERGKYQKLIRQYEAHSESDLDEARQLARRLDVRPLISILMPVYNTDERYLRAAIDSVRAQVYDPWELCIADDHSTNPHIRTILAEYASCDSRIKIATRHANGHISAASNTALDLVTGHFTALMDHDDELSPLALYFVAKEINKYAEARIIYSDEDKISEKGKRFAPYFKPDWNPELLLGVNYVNHLTVYRTDLLRDCGAFRVGYEGSQDYDLLLRAAEHCFSENIRHIPRVLYHWRAIRGSVAYASDEKPYAHDRARVAIAEHLKRRNIDATVVRSIGQLHKVIYRIPDPRPTVSVILHGEGRTAALKQLLRAGGNFSHEIISTPHVGTPDLYARLNIAADGATGSILCFLNVNIDRGSKLWLESMIGHAIQPGTGAVGPMIYDERKRIKSAGFVLGVGDGIASAFQNSPLSPRGRSIRLDVPQNVAAVSADCLVIARDKFNNAGGFDAEAFGKKYGDVDLCCRLVIRGLMNVWTPRAEVLLTEGSSVGANIEFAELRKRWIQFFIGDTYYNPNLSHKTADYSLADPPVLEKY